jgi:GTP-binding protein
MAPPSARSGITDPMNPYYSRARFLTSAAALHQLPPAAGVIEVAFAGRSNAGKSSAINVICNQASLARTSKTPGRTRLINFFSLDERRRLVDLPGYGFAKVARPVRVQWQGLLTDYIEQRENLRGIVLMMDIRHPLRDLDVQMIEWCRVHGLALHILLTKADKLKRGPAKQVLMQVRNAVGRDGGVSTQLFSALKREGIDAVHEVLDDWLETPRPDGATFGNTRS